MFPISNQVLQCLPQDLGQMHADDVLRAQPPALDLPSASADETLWCALY